MSRKKGRMHHQKHSQQNIVPETERALASHTARVDTDTHHCEEAQNKNLNKEEPPQLSRKWEWDLMTLLTAILAAGTIVTFGVLLVQLQDARDNFRKDQRPYVWITNGSAERPNVYREAGYPDRIAITVHYTNFGKSPAVKVRSAFQIQTGIGANTRFKPMPLRTSDTILPTGKDDFFIATSDPLSADDIAKTLAITGGVIVAARWQFLDLSGHLYESDICIANEAAPHLSWNYCENSNKMKDCAVDDCNVWP